MTPQEKANELAKTIEELIELKLRDHFREYHAPNDPIARFKVEQVAQDSLVDRNRLNMIRVNLGKQISDLFSGV
jgi:hypothetical protein